MAANAGQPVSGRTMEPQRTRAAEAVMTERCHIIRLSSGPLHSRRQTSKSLPASCEGRPPDAISLCLQNGPERLFTHSSQHSSFRLTPIAAETMMSPMHLISPSFNRNQNVRQAQRLREVHHRLGKSAVSDVTTTDSVLRNSVQKDDTR